MDEVPKRLPTRHPEPGTPQKLSPESAELLTQMQGRLETFDSAATVWRDYLTDRDHALLGGNVEAAWRQQRGTLGMVSHARKCSRAEALLWLIEETGALPVGRLSSLRQELGLPTAVCSAPPSDLPSWSKLRGKLLLGGKIIRSFRSTTIAHRAVAILDAFEECGWCEHIDNPLRSGDAHQMREAVFSLNKGLKAIRFISDGTSAGIRWELRKATAQLPRTRVRRSARNR